jgi:hypothetical protein
MRIGSLQQQVGICELLAIAAMVLVIPTGAAAGEGERRGEIGIQVGVRWADDDIVPADRSRAGGVFGIAGAYAFNTKWALIGDLNMSTHDSILFCDGTDSCNALTPEVKYKVLRAGIERRFNSGPKNGRWVLGLTTGLVDMEWNGFQVHHGLLSLGFGRRMPTKAGIFRWDIRLEPTFGERFDPDLSEVVEGLHLSSVAVMMGWSWGIGGRLP